MLKIIICAIVGAIIGSTISGTRKLARIRRLKGENKMLLERNEACSKENTAMHGQMNAERDKSREMRRELLLWESLSNEIVNHRPCDMAFVPAVRVPEMGIQILKGYSEQLKECERRMNAAHILIDQKMNPDQYDSIELESWKPKAEILLGLTRKTKES